MKKTLVLLCFATVFSGLLTYAYAQETSTVSIDNTNVQPTPEVIKPEIVEIKATKTVTIFHGDKKFLDARKSQLRKQIQDLTDELNALEGPQTSVNE